MTEQGMRERKTKHSVGRRLTALIIFMIVGVSGVMMFVEYFRFKESTEEYYARMGETTAGIVALIVDADSLDTYIETLTTDAAYEDTMRMLQLAREECEAQTLYLFRATEEGITYIYDTDPSDMWCELGYFDTYNYTNPDGTIEYLYPDVTAQQLRDGGSVETIIGITQYGWTITVNEPLYGSDGSCKGYLGIDFDVNRVIAERTAYLWKLVAFIFLITTVFAVIYTRIIRVTIIRPINTMAKAADNFLVNSLESGELIGESDILSMGINTGDELQSLAEALKSMVRKIGEYLTNLNIVTIKSETDALTALYNRGAFQQQVSAHLRVRPNKEQLDAFMMIDVDYFKEINDHYGHAEGDKVLSECAHALRKVLRDSDIVGRLGGDEFAVFCKSIGSASIAEDKARQIRSAWRAIVPQGGAQGVTASIGIAFAPRDGQGYQELFNKADAALYKAKEAGRDGFYVSV